MTIRGLLGVSRNIFSNCLEENDPEEKLRETFWNISRTVLTEVQKLPRVIFSCLIPLLLQQNCLKSLPLRNPSENKEISVNSEESADELGILDYLRIWKKAHYPCAKFHYKYRNSIKYLLFQSVGIAHHAGTFSPTPPPHLQSYVEGKPNKLEILKKTITGRTSSLSQIKQEYPLATTEPNYVYHIKPKNCNRFHGKDV